MIPARVLSASRIAGFSVVILTAAFGLIFWYLFIEEMDVLILDARIMDGSGAPSFQADIGIRQGRIVYIGSVGRVQAFFRKATELRIIDAKGLSLAPGFIDVHTHVETNLSAQSPFKAPNFIQQGVTTIITGNCGRSFVEVSNLFEWLSNNGSEINVASLIGHNSVRSAVMGKTTNREAGPYEIRLMADLVEGAMKEGALGFSTGLTYQPGSFAAREELIQLSKVASKYDGIYVTHLRDEGIRGLEAISEAVGISQIAGVRLQISHFKAAGRSQWGSAPQRLSIIDLARRKGTRITLDQYPYLSSSTSLDVLLPPNELDHTLASKLRDSGARDRLRLELIQRLRENGWQDFSYVRIANHKTDSPFNGLTIPEALQLTGISNPRFGMDPVSTQAEFILDLLSKGGAQMIYDEMNEIDLLEILLDKNTMIGSDSAVRTPGVGMPHPRGFGTFPRVLSEYCREKQLIPFEEAIRRMTSFPAQTFGLAERGLIKKGYWADLVIFDPKTVRDRSTYRTPFEPPSGILYVFISGQIVLDHGKSLPVLPGKALKRSIN